MSAAECGVLLASAVVDVDQCQDVVEAELPCCPMPANYVRAFLKGKKNDYRDAEAIAEAVQRPTMRFIETVEGADLEKVKAVQEEMRP